MLVSRHWCRLALLLLLCLAALGCSGGTDEGGDGSARPSEEAPGAPGAPGNGGNGGKGGNGPQAIGAPINIPAITQSQGLPLDEVRPRLEREIIDECGGELCVTLRVEARDVSEFTACQFVTTDPEPGAEVDRGETVVIVTGALPCTPETTVEGGGGGEQPPEETGTTQDGQSQPPTSS